MRRPRGRSRRSSACRRRRSRSSFQDGIEGWPTAEFSAASGHRPVIPVRELTHASAAPPCPFPHTQAPLRPAPSPIRKRRSALLLPPYASAAPPCSFPRMRGKVGMGARAAGARELARQPVCPHPNPSGPAQRAGRSDGPRGRCRTRPADQSADPLPVIPRAQACSNGRRTVEKRSCLRRNRGPGARGDDTLGSAPDIGIRRAAVAYGHDRRVSRRQRGGKP